MSQPSWNKDKPLFNNQGFPSSLRLLIIGPSNCGKSFLLLRLILEDRLDFENLYLFTPSLHQMEYRILVESFKRGLDKSHINAIFENQEEIEDPIELITEISSKLTKKNTIKIEAYDNDAELPNPNTFDEKKRNLLILDDCAYGTQSNIHSYFIRGRHNNINCVYLSQNYFQLPRRSIRSNSNCFIFFQLSPKDISNIWQDIASIDYPNIDDFKRVCNEAWKQHHGYIFIDTTQSDRDKKYKSNCF